MLYMAISCAILIAALFAPCVIASSGHRTPRAFAEKGCQASPPMSVVWRIPELLFLIASRLSATDQTQMVLVCWAFWMATTPLLWKKLPQDTRNRHILNLMPTRVREWLESGGHDALLQTEFFNVRSPEWDRFFQHTRMVKSFTIMLGDSDGYQSIALLKALDTLGIFRLFPRLETLRVRVWKLPAHAEVVRCLFSPSIRHLTLEWVGGAESDLVPLIPVAVVRMLAATHNLSLTTFRIGATDSHLSHIPSAVYPVSRAIEAQTALEHLHVNDFQWRFLDPFIVAGRLPNLLTASFTEDGCEYCPFENDGAVGVVLPSKGFFALRTMRAELTAKTVPRLLASIQSTTLDSLEIFVQVEEARTCMTGVLEGISRFSQLKTIRFIYAQTKGTWKDFEVLLSCSLLESVTLKGYRASLVFTDAEIALMGGAWPQLQDLEIEDLSRLPPDDHGEVPEEEGTEDAFYAPKVTLSGLAQLTRDCSQLQRLKIAIDATIFPTPEELSTNPPNSVEDLNFPCSLVDEREDEVAQAIALLWPAQRAQRPEGGCWHSWWYDPYDGSESEFTSVLGQRWLNIWKKVTAVLTESS